MVYILSFISCLFFAKVATIAKPKQSLYFSNNNLVLTLPKVVYSLSIFLIFFILELVAGLRYMVGTDYWTYSMRHIPEVLKGINFRTEPLYREVIKLGSQLGGNQWIFVLTHILIIGFIILAFSQQSDNIFFSVFILLFSGFFNNSLSMMRQTIAIAIFVYAFRFVKEKKPITYFLLLIFAYYFHNSALFFVIIYPLFNMNIKFTLKRSIILLLSMFAFGSLINQSLFFISSITGSYQNYFEGRYAAASWAGAFLIPAIAIYMVIIISNLYIKKQLLTTEEKKILNFYSYIGTITMGITLIFQVIPSNYRIFYMLYSIHFFSIPFIFSLNFKYKKIVIPIFCIMLILFFVYSYIIQNSMETYPYKSIFGLNK